MPVRLVLDPHRPDRGACSHRPAAGDAAPTARGSRGSGDHDRPLDVARRVAPCARAITGAARRYDGSDERRRDGRCRESHTALVAVIGGGIGGLVAARALLMRGLEVDVFEASPELREVGAGVALGPNAMNGPAAPLHLEEPVRAVAGETRAQVMRSWRSGTRHLGGRAGASGAHVRARRCQRAPRRPARRARGGRPRVRRSRSERGSPRVATGRAPSRAPASRAAARSRPT